jgi:hypothetical protein
MAVKWEYTSDGINYGFPFNQIGDQNLTLEADGVPANLIILAGEVMQITEQSGTGYKMDGYVISYDITSGYLEYSIISNYGCTDQDNYLNYKITSKDLM